MKEATDCRKCRNYSRLYAGAWCNAVEDRIVSLTVNNVQVLKKLDRLDGRKPAEQEFDPCLPSVKP